MKMEELKLCQETNENLLRNNKRLEEKQKLLEDKEIKKRHIMNEYKERLSYFFMRIKEEMQSIYGQFQMIYYGECDNDDYFEKNLFKQQVIKYENIITKAIQYYSTKETNHVIYLKKS